VATWLVGYSRRYPLGVIGATAALVVLHLAEEELEKHRPLVPPVTEELRVVGRHDDGTTVHVRAQVLDLPLAVEHEVAGVLGGAQYAWCGSYGPLVVRASGG
jgi:hypothetical protein